MVDRGQTEIRIQEGLFPIKADVHALGMYIKSSDPYSIMLTFTAVKNSLSSSTSESDKTMDAIKHILEFGGALKVTLGTLQPSPLSPNLFQPHGTVLNAAQQPSLPDAPLLSPLDVADKPEKDNYCDRGLAACAQVSAQQLQKEDVTMFVHPLSSD